MSLFEKMKHPRFDGIFGGASLLEALVLLGLLAALALGVWVNLPEPVESSSEDPPALVDPVDP